MGSSGNEVALHGVQLLHPTDRFLFPRQELGESGGLGTKARGVALEGHSGSACDWQNEYVDQDQAARRECRQVEEEIGAPLPGPVRSPA